jgi:hypothetical protein
MSEESLLLNLLITWLLFPFGAAFVSSLLPSLGRGLNLVAAASTLVVGAWAWLGGNLQLNLIGELGVQLQVDRLAAPFLLLNGLVVLAVLLDRWRRLPPGPFLLLLLVLLGGLNSAFLAIDLVSLYVALEVVGITAFLLILQKRDGRQLWIALRYLLISNSVMTLYLVGVALLYLQVGSFRIASLVDLPAGDQALAVILALVLVGLLTKSGLFLAGLWLPRTHAEAPAEVSALLSGVVVAGGLCPLLRLNAQLPGLQPLLAWVGLGSAVLGLVYALLESDLKRLLAWSTLSQLGLVLLNPVVGGVYALLQSKEAEHQRSEAELQRDEADRQRDVADAQKKEAQRQEQEAGRQRDAAEKERIEAERQRDLAKRQRERADIEAENARQQAYRSQLRIAADLIGQQELAEARKILLEVPPSVRRWEWAYLISRCGATPRELKNLKPEAKWLT